MKQTPGLQTAHKTILLVDDDAAILRFISGLLVKYKYNVLVASSGREALQVSRDCNCAIDLLLSDFEMPGMNGISLAAELSLDRPQIKVLLMSGFTSGMLVLNEGWHFLAKPFVPSQLRALIKGLISPDEHSKL